MSKMPLPAEGELLEVTSPLKQENDASHLPPAPAFRVIILSALALAAGIVTASWAATAGQVQLTGYLRAEQSTIYSPRTGRLERLFVTAGQSVKPRQPLLQLADDALDYEIAAKSREVRSFEATLEQCRARAEVQISLELKNLNEELHRTRLHSAELLREHFAASFEHATWRSFTKETPSGRWLAVLPDSLSEPDRVFSSLASEPSATPEESRLRAVLRQENAHNLAEVKKVEAELCDHHVRELENLRRSLPEQIRKAAGVDVAEAKVALAAEQFDALRQQKAAMFVSAPGHGIVGAFARHPSDPVNAGEALVTVLDRERPFVVVDIPSREIHRVIVGDVVNLEIAGEGCRGRIESISPQAQRVENGGDSLIAVRLNPAGKTWPDAAIGSVVTVRLK